MTRASLHFLCNLRPLASPESTSNTGENPHPNSPREMAMLKWFMALFQLWICWGFGALGCPPVSPSTNADLFFIVVSPSLKGDGPQSAVLRKKTKSIANGGFPKNPREIAQVIVGGQNVESMHVKTQTLKKTRTYLKHTRKIEKKNTEMRRERFGLPDLVLGKFQKAPAQRPSLNFTRIPLELQIFTTISLLFYSTFTWIVVDFHSNFVIYTETITY